MSDPTPEGTVRGWLETLSVALGASTNAELLAEMRFLNTNLFGGNAISPPAIAPPSQGWLRYAFVAELGNEFGDPTRLPLAELLRLTTEYGGANWFLNRLQEVAAQTTLTANALYNSSGTRVAVTLSGLTNPINSIALDATEIRDNTAREQGRNIAQYLFNILSLLDGTFTGPATTLGQLLAELQCICDNTTPPVVPPEPPPAFAPAGCGTEDWTAAAESNGLSFAVDALLQEVDFQYSYSLDNPLTVGPGDPFNDAPFVYVTGTSNLPVCAQIQKSPDDPGVYTLQAIGTRSDGEPVGGVLYSMDVPPNDGQVATLVAREDGLIVYYRFLVTRFEDGISAVTWSGPQPIVYLATAPLS